MKRIACALLLVACGGEPFDSLYVRLDAGSDATGGAAGSAAGGAAGAPSGGSAGQPAGGSDAGGATGGAAGAAGAGAGGTGAGGAAGSPSSGGTGGTPPDPCAACTCVPLTIQQPLCGGFKNCEINGVDQCCTCPAECVMPCWSPGKTSANAYYCCNP